MRLALATLAVLALPLLPALGQEPTCYTTEDYMVATAYYNDVPGTRFTITPLSDRADTSPCTDEFDSSFVIGDRDDPLWFSGVTGNYLVLTRSTGPDGDIVIYDLDNPPDPVVDVPVGRDVVVEEGGVTFWQRVGEGTAKNCPDFALNQANYLGSAIFAESRFDTATGVVERSGKQACFATQ